MERERKAVKRYFELRGYDVLDVNFQDFMVVLEPDWSCLVFVYITATDKPMHKIKPHVVKRSDFEKVASKFLMSHDDYVDLEVRYDELVLSIIGTDRALIKHRRYANSVLED